HPHPADLHSSPTRRSSDLLGQGGRAIAVGLDYLRRVGIDWPPHPTEEDVRREYERIWAQLGGRTVEELIELPLMSDPVTLATLEDRKSTRLNSSHDQISYA